MAVFHESQQLSRFFGDAFGGPSGTSVSKVVRVDAAQVQRLRHIHYQEAVSSFCAKMMKEILFKEDLKIFLGEKVLGASDVNSTFRQTLERDYVPFLQDAFDELMIVGICLVTFVKNGLGMMVPRVVSSETMGKIYEIRITADPRTGKPIYAPYWLVNKKGEALNEPKRARKAFVFDAVNSGPTLEGKLRSPLAALDKQTYFFDQMVQMDRVANFNLSDPSVLMVSPNTDIQTASLELMTPAYSADNAVSDLQGMFAQDTASLAHMNKHMSTQSGREWYPNGSHELKKQLHENIKTVPMGHSVVSSMPQPSLRSDFQHLVKQHYTIVCAAYGLDIRYIFSDGSTFKTADSSTLLRDRMDMTQRLWSQRLSNLCTDVMRHIYFPDECNLLFNTFAEIKPDADFETLLDKVDELLNDFKVVLPVPVSFSLEELTAMYQHQTISWEEFFNTSRSQGGMLPRAVPPEPKIETGMEETPNKRKAPSEDDDSKEEEDPPPRKKQRKSKDKEKAKDKEQEEE